MWFATEISHVSLKKWSKCCWGFSNWWSTVANWLGLKSVVRPNEGYTKRARCGRLYADRQSRPKYQVRWGKWWRWSRLYSNSIDRVQDKQICGNRWQRGWYNATSGQVRFKSLKWSRGRDQEEWRDQVEKADRGWAERAENVNFESWQEWRYWWFWTCAEKDDNEF